MSRAPTSTGARSIAFNTIPERWQQWIAGKTFPMPPTLVSGTACLEHGSLRQVKNLKSHLAIVLSVIVIVGFSVSLFLSLAGKEGAIA